MRHAPRHRLPRSALLGLLLAGGCGGVVGAGADAAEDLTTLDPDAGVAPPGDRAVPAPDAAPAEPPRQLEPCAVGRCWDAPTLSSACGSSTRSEDFSSGKYNVHEYALSLRRDVPFELELRRTAGSWSPALILRDEQGATVHDGERSAAKGAFAVTLISSGRSGTAAALSITASADAQLFVFVSSWEAVDGDFAPAIATDARYELTVFAQCEPPSGGLVSPPNFDPGDEVGGYYLLPPSDPPGLYTRKADDCSRGTKLLIDVLYTVALRFAQLRPDLAPIAIRDLNEGSCSTVNHDTHDDGTHADVVAGCATDVSCADDQPKIDLAKFFVDTGEVCGIINNDTSVQAVINPYFTSKYAYRPWHDTFMRSVSGHTQHFHIRVKKPDGTCN